MKVCADRINLTRPDRAGLLRSKNILASPGCLAERLTGDSLERRKRRKLLASGVNPLKTNQKACATVSAVEAGEADKVLPAELQKIVTSFSVVSLTDFRVVNLACEPFLQRAQDYA